MPLLVLVDPGGLFGDASGMSELPLPELGT
jgi:hypothetical protein